METNGRTDGAASGLTQPNNASRERVPTRVRGLLAKPLDRLLVAERESRDGRVLHYIEGWTAINQANRIFGYDGWGTELVGEVGFRPIHLTDPDTEATLAVGMYSAVVRVTARGCAPRSDAGCGFVTADTPEAHETAYKGAVTDALKRALRYFGNQFGNGFYDRRAMVDRPPPVSLPATPEKLKEMRSNVIKLSARIGLEEPEALAQVRERYGEPLDALTEEQLTEAIRALAEEFNRRNARPASERKQPKAA
jgi:DNA recombination protein Rad52